jgi:YjbE family integral membrane protein
MPTTILKDIGILIAIILVDLALSGDNALVIGSVAAKLAPSFRRRAITFGGLIAIVLRIGLTFLAVYLLRIPYVNLIGGVAVFIIAVQLIRDIGEQKSEEAAIESATPRLQRRALTSDVTFMRAITTIAIADLSMSLDNALAIAALAQKELLLLAIGLFFSVIFLLLASAVIASIIARFPILMYLSGAILAVTAASMIFGDPRIEPTIARWDVQVPGPLFVYLYIGVVILFALIAWILHPRSHRTAHSTSN